MLKTAIALLSWEVLREIQSVAKITELCRSQHTLPAAQEQTLRTFPEQFPEDACVVWAEQGGIILTIEHPTFILPRICFCRFPTPLLEHCMNPACCTKNAVRSFEGNSLPLLWAHVYFAPFSSDENLFWVVRNQSSCWYSFTAERAC